MIVGFLSRDVGKIIENEYTKLELSMYISLYKDYLRCNLSFLLAKDSPEVGHADTTAQVESANLLLKIQKQRRDTNNCVFHIPVDEERE